MDGVMHIRRMSPGDMDAACEVIGLAFEDNPNTLAVVRGDRSKARGMMQAAVRAAKLGRKYSHVLLAEDEGRVVGRSERRGVADLPAQHRREAEGGTRNDPSRGLGAAEIVEDDERMGET